MSALPKNLSHLSPEEKRALLAQLLQQDAARPQSFPASFSQRRMWFLDQLEPETLPFAMATAIRVVGELNIPALHGCLNEIVRRHESLRTSFAEVDGDPIQIVAPSVKLNLPIVDISGLTRQQIEAEASRLAMHDSLRPFDLTRPPMLRATLIRIGPTEHVLMSTMHHIISDGWSTGIFVREIGILYPALLNGKPSPLPDLPIQYADYALWQRTWLQGEVLEKQIAYWVDHLRPPRPALLLPADHPHTSLRSTRGATQRFVLSVPLSNTLSELSRKENVTLFMTLMAALEVLLQRYTGQDDILLGTLIANRNRPEIEDLIGLFINTLVLRTDLSGQPTFRELLARVRDVTLGAYAHQDVPIERLIEVLQPDRNLRRTPLFQVMFVWQNAPTTNFEPAGLKLGGIEIRNYVAEFDLTLTMAESPKGTVGFWSYNADLFEDDTISRLTTHFQALLEGLVIHPEMRLGDLPLITEPEREQLTHEWNAPVDYSQADAFVHRLFEDQAARTPAAAIIAPQPGAGTAPETINYHDLNQRANQLAHHLRGLGVGPETRVGICIQRSIDMVVSVLAVLKAGGAYVPLDPAYPAERLAALLSIANVSVLLTHSQLLAGMPSPSTHIICLDTSWETIGTQPSHNPALNVSAENLAYVMFTSGSTGMPKGVMVPHRAIANYTNMARDAYQLSPASRVLQFASLSWDTSAEEIYPSLTSGATLVLRTEAMLDTAAAFIAACNQWELTHLNLPTAYWHNLLVQQVSDPTPFPTYVQHVIIGGERALEDDLGQWHAWVGEAVRLVNTYGATEAAAVTTQTSLAESSLGAPIGRPVSNVRVYVLDEQLQLAPIGVPGELCIGGLGVARGYFNRPDLTAERFIPDPISREAGRRLYRTGDVARWRADGQLLYVGRKDFQVKVRGYRIELEEVESVIQQHAAVREAVVVAQEAGLADWRLVAYVAPQAGQVLTAAKLRNELKTILPAYMLPSAFVVLEALPRTASGKVNRQALPNANGNTPTGRAPYVAPRSPTEDVLVGVWQEVLRTDVIGVHDSFFELGGHSLLATQVLSRVRNIFSVEVPLRSIFKVPTIAGLAAEIEKAQRTGEGIVAPPIKPVDRAGSLPLSFAQERLWFLEQLAPENTVYTLPLAVRLTGKLDEAALRASLDEIVRRHEALRTTFRLVNGQPVQMVGVASSLQLPLIDLRGISTQQQKPEALRAVQETVSKPFDLEHGPLVRGSLIRLADDDCILLLAMHHIVADGWSVGVFIREITALYRAYCAGQPSPLPDLPLQYADYAHWQRHWVAGDVLQTYLAYWQQQLVSLETLQLPTDRPRAATQTYNGAIHAFELSADLTEALRGLSRQYDSTIFMTLLAGFNVLLSRYTRQNDIAVGSHIANRNREEIEGLIGFFVNTLVLRTRLGPQAKTNFVEVLKQVREMTLEAYTHQDLPFEKIVEALQPVRDLSRQPLFQVAFVLQNAPQASQELWPGLTLSLLEIGNPTSKFDMTLYMAETVGTLSGTLEYNPDLFDAATMARLASHYERLLAWVADSAKAPLIDLPLLDEVEQRTLVEWNRTETRYQTGADTLPSLLAAQAARTPHHLAVKLAASDLAASPLHTPRAHQLTYAQLDQHANQLAHYLNQQGVGPETRVGVCMDRSIEMVVALLGILKAGGAYVPMDPDYPLARLAYMLDDANVSLLITQAHLCDRLPETRATLLCLDTDFGALSQYPTQAPDTYLTPDNLAYIIYTSGSTGQPKGAMNTHHGIVNRLLWMQVEYHLTDANKVLQKTPFSFDVSVWEFFWPLLNGASLVMAQPGGHRDAEYLVNIIQSEQITTMHFVPSMLDIFLQAQNVEACTSLRQVMCSGEALPKEYVERFYLRLNANLHNLYGPTEAAVDVSYWACEPNDDRGASVPIGKPIANLQLHVLGDALEQLPVGVVGELYLGGVGLGRGYWDRPSLTAERFIPNPYSQTAGERLYRTGDLARWRSDGVVEYMGRADFQVKIRGYRIELGEIESALRAQAGVRDAVVIAREDTPGDKRLVAYLVAGESQTPQINSLRDALSRTLPSYMVPSVFITLDQLPLSPNGKINRQALPKPQGTLVENQQIFQPLSTPTEELLAAIWTHLLDVPRISALANFFELGGHSLLATRLAACIREQFNVDVSLRTIFELPTLQALARTIDLLRQSKTGATLPSITPLPRTESMPVSFAQQRLWFIHQLEPNSAAYNAFSAIRINGALDPDVLERSLNALVERHEILRTTYAFKDELVQVIAESLDITLPLLDYSDRSPEAQEAALRALVEAESQRPFDLETGPIFRAQLVKLGPQAYAFLMAMHHINSDAWSFPILFKELAQIYQAFANGQPSPLAPLPIQYADYAAWQRRWLAGDVLNAQLAYWRQTLEGVPSLLELPTDHPRPPAQTYRGAASSFQLSKETADQIKALTQTEGATLAMGLLAGFEMLLHRYTGQDDFAVSQGIGSRRWRATESLIGPFINTLLLRASFSPSLTVRQLLQQVRETALDAYDHQDLPFEKLVEALQPTRDPSYNPLAQVMFVFHNTPVSHIDLSDLQFDIVAADQHSAQFDLLLRMTEVDGVLMGQLEYNTDLFERKTVDRMVGHYQVLLSAALQNPGAQVDSLPLLTLAEHQQILVDWNQTAASFPADQTLHQLFEAQVGQTPNALAVITSAGSLTYDELNQRANRLAHYLRSKGVGPNVTVGLSVERSVSLAVGLMGILKAGGAYVPLDPNYPAERLAYMLEDSQVKVLLAQSHLLPNFPATAAEVVALDGDWPLIANQLSTNPVCNTLPEHLVYVIYTSGSTGQPKGVMLDHRGRVNNFTDYNQRFNYSPADRLLGISSLSFDMCAYDVLGTLLSGAAIVLPAAGREYDPSEWLSLIHQYKITIWHSVPSLLALLIDAAQSQPELSVSSLRLAILGGDWIPMTQPDRIKALAPGLQFVSLGGATEISVDSTIYEVEQVDPAWRSIPYGHPLTNQLAYVVDNNLQPTPIGVPGELLLGGQGVAWGYLNRPDLTAEKFIPNPFGIQPGNRLYKTGDLARWRSDGNLELLGRLDHQVKIYGHRVELGEITATLRQHPSLADAVVAARKDAGGPPVLVGYVVFAEGADTSAADLRTYLKQHLPDYMVPNQFVALPALPLTPNGKLDRKALPAPALGNDADHDYVAPQNDLEAQLAATWQNVLGLEQVGITDNFFELGGDSFKAIRVVNAYPGKLGLLDIFKTPTIRELALRLSSTDETKVTSNGLLQLLKQASGQAVATLICLPYDGGNAVIYTPLAAALPDAYTVYAVSFPGHDFNRTHEAFEPLDAIVGRLMDEIQQNVDGPIVLYGHCGGTATAVELARRLEEAGREVQAVYMGGYLPGTKFSRQFESLIAKMSGQRTLSDPGMLAFLQSLGAFGDYTDPAQLTSVLNAVRHDSENATHYFRQTLKSKKAMKLSVPLICLIASGDPVTPGYRKRYKEWEAFSNSVSLMVLNNNDHYFIKQHAKFVADAIQNLKR
jgi:amino acid adenylation domain-containing protein